MNEQDQTNSRTRRNRSTNKQRYECLMGWRSMMGIKERPPKTNEKSEKNARQFELELITAPLQRKLALETRHKKQLNRNNDSHNKETSKGSTHNGGHFGANALRH